MELRVAKDLVVLLLSFKIVLSEDVLSYCPDVLNKNQSTFTIENTCYHLVQNPNSPTTREFARQDCRSRNGDLLTIKNQQTQEKVIMAVDRMSDSHTVLLGLIKESDHWKWIDGEIVAYNNWEVTSEPRPGDCGRLNVMEAGRWEKVDCATSDWFTVYICEHNKHSKENGGQNSDDTNSADVSIRSSYSFLIASAVFLLTVLFAEYL